MEVHVMRVAIFYAAVLAALALVPWWAIHWRRQRTHIVLFFWKHEIYYRPTGRQWLSADYVAGAYGLGTHRCLRELAAEGVLERRTDGQGGELYRVRGSDRCNQLKSKENQ